MGIFEQQRTHDRLIISVSKEAYLPDLPEALRARNDAASLILPETEINEEQIRLCFNLGGMQSLNEASLQMDQDALLNAIRQLTEAVLDLPGHGLDITQVLTATDQVMLENGQIRLLCVCTRQNTAGRAAARKALIQQIRQLTAGREGLVDLAGFLANPYCSLEAIRARLLKKPAAQEAVNPAGSEDLPDKMKQNPVPAEKPAEKEEVGNPDISEPEETAPEEQTPSFPNPFKPAFFTQMNAGPAEAGRANENKEPDKPMSPETKEQGDDYRPFIPMGGNTNSSGAGIPFKAMESAYQNRPAQNVHKKEPEQDSRAPVVPARTAHGDINEETVFDAPLMQPGSGDMDEPTADDGMIQARAAGIGSMDDPTVYDSGSALRSENGKRNSGKMEKPEKTADSEQNTGKEKEAENKGKVIKREKEKRENPYLTSLLKISQDPKKAFWESIVRIAVYAGITAVLAILAGAFLGGTGIILVILAAAIGLALLFSRGYLALKWPKKPETAIQQPEAPNVEKVFTVRLRMISQNLPTRQEIIIRENNQIIGTDPSVCRSPVNQRGISRRHCRISCKHTGGQEEYFITDLGSTNGTRLNGEQMKPNAAYPLKLGDHVTLAGKYDFKISSDAY